MWVMGEEDDTVLLEDEPKLLDAPASQISVSLNSFVGIDNPKTMRLTRLLQDTPVVRCYA